MVDMVHLHHIWVAFPQVWRCKQLLVCTALAPLPFPLKQEEEAVVFMAQCLEPPTPMAPLEHPMLLVV